MQQVFYGKVENGNLRLISQDQYEKLIRGLEGQSIKLVLGKRPKKRTAKQQRYYFGAIVKPISDYTGMAIGDTHEWLKKEFAPKQENIIKGKNGQELVIVSAMSTTDLLTVQFRDDFIEKIKVWAASFLGLYLADPNEIVD